MWLFAGNLGFAGLLSLCLSALASATTVTHTVPEGIITLRLPSAAEGWQCTFPEQSGDLLFPDGVTLASMQETAKGGTMVTISLDERHPTPAAEQAAFLALARDRVTEGRMEIWEESTHRWIVQEFRSPSERVLAARTYLGPYALAYLFWFEADGDPTRQSAQAREILRQWHPRWQPTPPE